MDTNEFIITFTICYSVTMAIVEVIKKYVDKDTVNINLIALCVGTVVGIFGTGFYFILKDIPLTTKTVIIMLCAGPATALASNLGYDKILYEIKKIIGG